MKTAKFWIDTTFGSWLFAALLIGSALCAIFL